MQQSLMDRHHTLGSSNQKKKYSPARQRIRSTIVKQCKQNVCNIMTSPLEPTFAAHPTMLCALNTDQDSFKKLDFKKPRLSKA